MMLYCVHIFCGGYTYRPVSPHADSQWAHAATTEWQMVNGEDTIAFDNICKQIKKKKASLANFSDSENGDDEDLELQLEF